MQLEVLPGLRLNRLMCVPACQNRRQLPLPNTGPSSTPTPILKMGDETMRRTLYVGNLPDDITTKELNDEFRKFGRIVR
jgi:RNA recognition motif-containing protein